MSTISIASLDASLTALEATLEGLPDKQARQLALINVINEHTGSTFTGFNLNDPLGRILGCVLWPMPPERVKIVSDLGPTLSALLLANPLHQLVWDSGPGTAFAMPDALLHATMAYKHVYRVAGMNYVACYDYPAEADGNHVIVVISRPDRAFSRKEVQALQLICHRFASTISKVDAGGLFAPAISNVEDYTVELSNDYRPLRLTPYTHALIAHFYGPLRDHDQLLPTALVHDIEAAGDYYAKSVLPMESGACYAFSKRSQGRLLCCAVNKFPQRPIRLTLYEDLKHLRRLENIKAACRSLRRDRYMVFATCLNLLEGENSETDIRKLPGLSAYKPSSARRILSRARAVLASC